MSNDIKISSLQSAPIVILDFGWGNIYALESFLLRLGRAVNILSLSEYLHRTNEVAHAIVIPGVGSAERFATIRTADKTLLIKKLNKERLVLGICLGMQILCRYLQEGNCSGLKIFDCDVTRFSYVHDGIHTNLGYEDVSGKMNKYGEQYFCHNFFVEAENLKMELFDEVILVKGHIAALLRLRNFIGVQFHPEKSGNNGLNLMRHILL